VCPSPMKPQTFSAAGCDELYRSLIAHPLLQALAPISDRRVQFVNWSAGLTSFKFCGPLDFCRWTMERSRAVQSFVSCFFQKSGPTGCTAKREIFHQHDLPLRPRQQNPPPRGPLLPCTPITLPGLLVFRQSLSKGPPGPHTGTLAATSTHPLLTNDSHPRFLS